jgi:periplasmic protein CpxP/Spy
MNTSNRIGKTLLTAALTVGLALSAVAQVQEPHRAPDEVDQLAQMVNLTEEQQRDIRGAIAELTPRMEELQTRAQTVQEELQDQVGPDFKEEEIRATASRLGEMAGEMTALTAILQSRVASILTEEQRDELEQRARQQEQMEQQVMQQQFQQQIEEQLRQQEHGQRQQQPQPQSPAPDEEDGAAPTTR